MTKKADKKSTDKSKNTNQKPAKNKEGFNAVFEQINSSTGFRIRVGRESNNPPRVRLSYCKVLEDGTVKRVAWRSLFEADYNFLIKHRKATDAAMKKLCSTYASEQKAVTDATTKKEKAAAEKKAKAAEKKVAAEKKAKAAEKKAATKKSSGKKSESKPDSALTALQKAA